MKIDEWMEAALIDDTLVAKALLGLKKTSVPELQWGHRKTRSRPASVIAKFTRFSPRTPLSWSGDTTVSGSDYSSSSRSKGAFANESLKSASNKRSSNKRRTFASGTPKSTSNKRSTKKRTFAELKEEENLLFNERLHLEKFNFRLKSAHKIGEISTQPLAGIPDPMGNFPMGDANSALPKQNKCSDVASKSGFSDARKDIGTFGRGFLLPDLNMELSEDGTIPNPMYGIS